MFFSSFVGLYIFSFFKASKVSNNIFQCYYCTQKCPNMVLNNTFVLPELGQAKAFAKALRRS